MTLKLFWGSPLIFVYLHMYFFVIAIKGVNEVNVVAVVVDIVVVVVV